MQAEMDLPASLPDEVLCQVFSHITSIPNRFKLAAVNQKFRRCMLTEINKPQALELDFHRKLICGQKLPLPRWAAAVEVLAKVARFSEINLGQLRSPNFLQTPKSLSSFLPNIIGALTSKDCLAQVTAIRANPFLPKPPFGCIGVDNLIHKCPKLSILELDFSYSDVIFDPDLMRHFDLISALKDKPITQLKLERIDYSHQKMAHLFRALKPNSLKKLHLLCPCAVEPYFDVVQLVRALCASAGESLESIALCGQHAFGRPAHQPHAQLFECIQHLSVLHSFTIEAFGGGEGSRLQQIGQLTAALKSLFSNYARETPLVVKYSDQDLNYQPICRILARIRQIKEREIPGLSFCFDDEGMEMLKLSLGNVSMGMHSWFQTCEDRTCVQCRSSYPRVISELKRKANRLQSGHLENYWLTRCAINKVVLELSKVESRSNWNLFNLVQDQNMATVIFERKNGGTQFQITVSIGQCFASSCDRCL